MTPQQFARELLAIGAVKFSPRDPFKYASGLRGPIYCDNRKILGHPKLREQAAQGLVKLVRQSAVEFDQICGLATAGIPHGALVAHLLGSPFCYIRSSAKEHGKGNLLEGDCSAGQRVVLVEDLVNQASSMRKAFEALVSLSIRVTGAFALVDYQMASSKKFFEQNSLVLNSMTNFSVLVEEALQNRFLEKSDEHLLKEWHNNPEAWS
jgi:orotate phosphoribosyltransferase